MCACVCVNPVEWRRTGLWRPLHQFVGKRSDAFGRDGGEGEGVLSVGFQTLDCVRISWPEGQLLLREREKKRGAEDKTRGEWKEDIKAESERKKKRWGLSPDAWVNLFNFRFYPSSHPRCLVRKSTRQTDLYGKKKKRSKRSHQAAELDRFVEQLIVDDALLGVSRFPGQLDAGVCHSANFEFARLAGDWGGHDQTVSQDNVLTKCIHLPPRLWLCIEKKSLQTLVS